MKILIVDDDVEVLHFTKKALQEEGFITDTASKIKEAFLFAAACDYDCIILDINLPDGSGLDLCESFRKSKITSPILFLTVRSNISDKLLGFNLGADDYLTKPFSIDELIVRVKSMVKRYSPQKKIVYNFGNFQFDPLKKTVQKDSQLVNLTKTESLILYNLVRQKGQPISREDIIERVYGQDYPITNSVDVLVGRLKRKLGAEILPLIQNIRAFGYVLNDETIS